MKISLTTIICMISISLLSQTTIFKTNSRMVFGTSKDKSASMGVGDIDKDGDMDVVIANGRHWPEILECNSEEVNFFYRNVQY